MNFVVGTLTLWGLNVLLVQPLADHWTRRRMARGGLTSQSLAGEQGEQARQQLASWQTQYFILADVLIMAIAGLILGVALGTPMIGFSWKLKFWPGMIALIVASLIGAGLA